MHIPYFDFHLLFREIKAFIYDSPFIDLGASKMPGCSFKVVGNPIITVAYAIGFPKNSKWRNPVSNLLLKYQKIDYFRKLKEKWFRGGCFYTGRSSQSAEEMKPVNFGGLFFILGGAIVVCFLILLGECLWSRHERKEGRFTPKRIGQSNKSSIILSFSDDQRKERSQGGNFSTRVRSETIPPFLVV